MKITLKAEVYNHTTTQDYCTLIVQTWIQRGELAASMESRDMITVPAKNAEKIAELINEQP